MMGYFLPYSRSSFEPSSLNGSSGECIDVTECPLQEQTSRFPEVKPVDGLQYKEPIQQLNIFEIFGDEPIEIISNVDGTFSFKFLGNELSYDPKDIQKRYIGFGKDEIPVEFLDVILLFIQNPDYDGIVNIFKGWNAGRVLERDTIVYDQILTNRDRFKWLSEKAVLDKRQQILGKEMKVLLSEKVELLKHNSLLGLYIHVAEVEVNKALAMLDYFSRISTPLLFMIIINQLSIIEGLTDVYSDEVYLRNLAVTLGISLGASVALGIMLGLFFPNSLVVGRIKREERRIKGNATTAYKRVASLAQG